MKIREILTQPYFSRNEAKHEVEFGAIAVTMSPFALTEGARGPIAGAICAGVGVLAVVHGLKQIDTIDKQG